MRVVFGVSSVIFKWINYEWSLVTQATAGRQNKRATQIALRCSGYDRSRLVAVSALPVALLPASPS